MAVALFTSVLKMTAMARQRRVLLRANVQSSSCNGKGVCQNRRARQHRAESCCRDDLCVSVRVEGAKEPMHRALPMLSFTGFLCGGVVGMKGAA